MITIYIWNEGQFNFSGRPDKQSDFAADLKRFLGHASLHVDLDDGNEAYMSLWPASAYFNALKKYESRYFSENKSIKQLSTDKITELMNSAAGRGERVRSFQEDITLMESGPDREMRLSFLNERDVYEVVNAFTTQTEHEYHLMKNNCSTVVINALQAGTQNISRNKIRDLQAFGKRVWGLFTQAAVITGLENMTRAEILMSQGFSPTELFFSLAELTTCRTPRSVFEYVEGIKAN